MTTFGQTPTNPSTDKFAFSPSEDGRAFTLKLLDFDVGVGSKGQPPVATGAFSLVLPLKGSAGNVSIDFTVQGVVVVAAAASATLVVSVNGQTIVSDFLPKADESIVKTLKFTAYAPVECRLGIVALVGCDSTNPEASAHVHIDTVDAEFRS